MNFMKKDETKCNSDQVHHQTCGRNKRVLHHVVFFIAIFTVIITTVMVGHHKTISREYPHFMHTSQDTHFNTLNHSNITRNTSYDYPYIKKELLNTKKKDISIVREMQSRLFQEALKAELEERMGEVYAERATQIVDAFIELEEMKSTQKETHEEIQGILEQSL